MVTTKTYTGYPGSYTINASEISYVRMLKVKREGMSYDIIISGTPASNQVLYTSSSGTLTFSISFNGDLGTDLNREQIYVLYDN